MLPVVDQARRMILRPMTRLIPRRARYRLWSTWARSIGRGRGSPVAGVAGLRPGGAWKSSKDLPVPVGPQATVTAASATEGEQVWFGRGPGAVRDAPGRRTSASDRAGTRTRLPPELRRGWRRAVPLWRLVASESGREGIAWGLSVSPCRAVGTSQRDLARPLLYPDRLRGHRRRPRDGGVCAVVFGLFACGAAASGARALGGRWIGFAARSCAADLSASLLRQPAGGRHGGACA